MSRYYKEGKVGMRWRVEKEVIAGKGQFICGALSCEERDMLHSYEVPFSYREAGSHKQALVKVRVCPECCYRLHYKKGKHYAKEVMRKQLEMEHLRRGHTWEVEEDVHVDARRGEDRQRMQQHESRADEHKHHGRKRLHDSIDSDGNRGEKKARDETTRNSRHQQDKRGSNEDESGGNYRKPRRSEEKSMLARDVDEDFKSMLP